MNAHHPSASTAPSTPRGQIILANESRFNTAHLSEPLTAYATGWQDPHRYDDLLTFLAPEVPVARRFEFRQAENSEAFVSETDDEREIGASFKRVEYTGSIVQAKTLNKGLTVRVDHDEAVGDDWEEHYVQNLLQRLRRNEVRRVLAALDTGASSSNAIWDSDANPDGDLRSLLRSATDASCLRPNRVLFGEAAWDMRAEAYDNQATAAAFRVGGLAPQELAQKMGVDAVRILRSRYHDGNSKLPMIGNTVYAYYASELTLKDEPSNVKRFVTPVEGGNYRVYVEPTAKYTDITVEHYSQIIVTSTLGLRKLNVSQS